jgi:hypothetical protein
MSRMSGIRAGSVLALCWALASCMELPALSDGVIDGKVVLGTAPITGATVAAYRLDGAGERDSEPIATTTTDETTGAFRLEVGAAYGTILLETTGGAAREHWSAELLVFDSSGPIDEREQLRAVLPLYSPAAPLEVAITPFTTMAAALVEGRLAAGKEDNYADAAGRANELMSAHLGVDILATVPADVRVEPVGDSWNDALIYGLALAGLSTLAGRIVDETPNSVFVVNTMSLTAALVDDAHVAGPGAEPIFDGFGPAGAIDIGLCIPPPECSGPAECPLCQLASRTLRRDLAESLLLFVSSEHNGTGLGMADVISMAMSIGENTEPELFGMVGAEPLDSEPPRIHVLPSPIHDERGDVISFDTNAVPMHEPIGPIIDLGADGPCPTVYKHTNRLDDASQNPLRWTVSIVDEGSAVKLVEYRVRSMTNAWPTEWTLAQPVAPGSSEYAIVLLRDAVPALATVEGTFEIEIRARDAFQNQAEPVSRCWMHTPLAAPLWVSPATEATGPASIRAVNLDPDSNLAALINAMDEREVMVFEVKNGTDTPVYVDFDYLQPGARYDLAWQRSNAELYSGTPPPGCTTDVNGTCPHPWPDEYLSDGAELIDRTLPASVWALRVWDVTSGTPQTVSPCSEPGCAPSEYRIEPRVSATRPRRYRVALVIKNLGVLAPRHPFEPLETYRDVALDPDLPTIIITGMRYGTWVRCDTPDMPEGCLSATMYRHYRAVRSAELRVTPLSIRALVAPTAMGSSQTPVERPNTFGYPPTIPSFTWTTDEPLLPPLIPSP